MKNFFKNAAIVALSAAVGFANGFFGGGGGMLLVPLLEKLMDVPVKKSHATAIAIVLPVSAAGAITYVINGYFRLLPTLGCAAGCVGGGLAGALLLKKLPAAAVGIGFALVMIAVAVKLIFFPA